MNLSTRAKLTYASFSLESLNLLNALCALRADWSIGLSKQAILLSFIAFSFAPAAIWAGAITPILASVESIQQIEIPKWSNLRYGVIVSSGLASETLTNITAQGTFTYRPELTLQGLILDNARQASRVDGNATSQSKMDNINYRYLGRSHGVGSSVGLRSPFVDPTVQTYQYTEPGFEVTSQCIYNDSSACYFENLTPDDFTLQIYNGVFQTPNLDSPWYIASAGQRDFQIVTVSAGFGKGIISDNYTHYVTMMSPAGRKSTQYGALEQVQCELTYEPYNFNIFVNVTNSTITTTPKDKLNPDQFKNATDIANAVTHRIYNLGQMLASTQWGSPIGDALMNNVNNLAFSRDESTIKNDTVLEAVSASMNSMVDSILAALAGSQMMMINATSHQPVTVKRQAVVVGEKIWIYLTVAINTILMFVFVIEALRTGVWKRKPDFDYMNVQDIVIAASAGGLAIAKDAQTMAGNVRIMLATDDQGHDKLVAASKALREDDIAYGENHLNPGATFRLSSRQGYRSVQS